VQTRFAKLVLGCIQREFPYQPAHVVQGADDLRRPRELHPAFYGCYDWHSAVHGHWLLAHLLRGFPALPEASAVRNVLNSHFSAENLRVEANYLNEHPGFERPYGWAWLLKLAHELADWQDADAKRWLAHLRPLTEVIEAHYLKWLPKQTYPIRSGVHTNTAFGLGFALDYSRSSKHVELENLIVERSIDYYGKDRNYPAAWEPGGNDFLSPCLVEADLMRRVFTGRTHGKTTGNTRDFPRWFEEFLGKIPKTLLAPATVSDRSDGQLAHLDGLNLSRAWCYFNLASALPDKKFLLETGKRHFESGLQHVASGDYAGEHWLATFAAYAASCAR
jgi:Protein of unknown function (DUF2891)